jgi:hypothetical protein
MNKPSDITSSVIPDDYVQEGESFETSVAEEVAHQRNMDRAIDNRDRAKLVAEVLRESALHIEEQGNIGITPAIGGTLLGVVVAMMQASGWKKAAGIACFDSVWGFEEGYDGKPKTN